jgi:arylsulfatase A-like enzyme
MKKLYPFSILLAALFSLPVAAQKSDKPNILFIAVDDLKPILGCYGNSLVKTPNIDRLAQMGTVFLNNYCQQSVCGPTRASLMTGMRPDYTKVWDLKTQMRDVNPDIVTIPQYLISQGYTTSGVGKIYHPSSAIDRIDPVSWSVPYLEADAKDYANGLGKPANSQYQKAENKQMISNNAGSKNADAKGGEKDEDAPTSNKKGPSTECIDVPDHAYNDGVYALKAKQQIIKLAREKAPFFMAVGFHKPHLPFVAPKKYWDLYNRADMPIAAFQEHSKDGVEIAYHKSSELRNYPDIPDQATLPGDQLRIGLKLDKQKELIHGYYAAVSYMDAQVGILLNTLDSLGILKNSVVVLWGDHGWHLGDHDLWEKHTTFEQANRSPLLIAAPGMKAGSSTALSEHVDIFPTLCQLAGVPVPTNLAGKSLVPVLKNKTAAVKDFAMSQYYRSLSAAEAKRLGYAERKMWGYSMRTDKFRFVMWMNDFTSTQSFSPNKVYALELYDFEKDPGETVNVANDQRYAKDKDMLYAKMVDFFKSQVQSK